MKQFQKGVKHPKGYSLTELVITLGIVSILMMMLTNIILLAFQTNIRIKERARTREEMTNLVSLIQKDFRNANRLDENDCLSQNSSPTCTIETDLGKIRWKQNNEIIERQKETKPNIYTTVYKSYENIIIESLTFQDLDSIGEEQARIMVTIKAKHKFDEYPEEHIPLEMGTLFRQIIISTRNITVY